MRLNKLFASMLLVGASFSGNGWAESFQPFEVTDIQVEGLQRVALGAALLSLPVKVGDTVDQLKLQQAIKSCMPPVTLKMFRCPAMVGC